MLLAALHPAVEATPIREVEVRQPRLPLGAKDGGGDRVGLPVQIPTEAERAFRLKPNTDSEGSRTPVPTESEQ